ncbi:GLPGLI family protein [Parabacteroides sp. PF5-5]|uniref:GLPGLI family protein n=1 Tax=unclassified Parabacteroides TaxID=2649774 RepID=UPI0024759E08|nr:MULTISPECIES: GLPGLI family protein [unclassified Parabacteroides]MDH6306379.1 GLPGLI family protein [Parabacteroides sp. PH5-39]MDH6314651.1 GLPGLI family protein [Parabacteroides sp. PF5-13]MDH6321090.1 GLPGLI family protein [Parabacteroides sp. PH5-13]MDH6324822.1 GLPGLI family protein [Parabacteroides sp. PH5-8]MDH6325497.1 GLPGLI family protein [Parabacteroides sp. PH5-41]
MKRKIKMAVWLIATLQLMGLQAQMVINIRNTNDVEKLKPIDEVQFAVEYQTSFISDTLKPDKPMEELMMLKVGKKSSVYYSYAKFLGDSVFRDQINKGVGMDVINESLQQYRSMISYKIYKNYPAGKTTMLEQLAMNRYRCEEKTDIPQWELLSDTLTVLSYPCRKAICQFRGRTWEAWYTSDIPRSEGPWKLQGLPGIILKAQDSKGHYTFEAIALAQYNGEEQVEYGDEGFEPISRKDLNKMYERNAADPVGFVKSSAPNVTVVVKGEDGQSIKNPKNMPFNPIELE